MIENIIKLLRINHYLKNLLIFIPLILSLNYYNLELIKKSIIAFIAFCCISSVVYILNDITDRNSDKEHPIKSKRPIANGIVSVKNAILLIILLLTASIYLSFCLEIKSLSMILGYLILNILYSWKLKKIALIDVSCIALGFIFRVLIGCFAINVKPSALIILLTFFVSMFFTFSKRKIEFQLYKDNTRISLKQFSEQLINQFVSINAVLSIAFYFTYVLDAQTVQRAGTPYLYVTVLPFTLIVYRLLYLTNQSNIDDPIIFFEKDNILKILFLSYFIVLFIVLNV